MIKVVTIAYHNEREITNLFKSLKRNFSDFNLIITRNSHVSSVISDPRVSYIGNGDNVGFGAAINRALSEISDTDVLFLLNSDVVINNIDIDFVVRQVRLHKILGPRCYSEENKLQDTFRKDVKLFRIFKRVIKRVLLRKRGSMSFEYDLKSHFQVDWIIGGAMMMSGKLFLDLGGFDERFFMYLEDCDLCLRARDLGYSIEYTDRVNCSYSADRKSLRLLKAKNRKQAAIHLKSFVYYIRKHWKTFFSIR